MGIVVPVPGTADLERLPGIEVQRVLERVHVDGRVVVGTRAPEEQSPVEVLDRQDVDAPYHDRLLRQDNERLVLHRAGHELRREVRRARGLAVVDRVLDVRLALLLVVTLLWGLVRLADQSGKSDRRELWLIAGKNVSLGEVNGRTARVISQSGMLTGDDTLRFKSWAMHLGIPLSKLYIGEADMRTLQLKEVGECDSLEYFIQGNRLILWCADPARVNIPETVMSGLVLVRTIFLLSKWTFS